MASLAKLLFCLLFIALCQNEARESKFFAKYVRLSESINNNYVPSTVLEQDVSLPSPSPAPAPVTSQISNVPASSPLVADYVPVPAPAPDQAPLEPGFGYAPAPFESEMYAEGSSDFTSTEATDVDNEEKFSDEEFSIEDPGERDSNTYSNGYSNNLSNNNGFWTSNYKGYNTNGYYYKSDQPQGMSDTRFVNNGEFYNNVEPENDGPKGYGLVRENKNEEGDYYGNNDKSKYEFDSMEEYERQEGYPDVEKQFIP